MSDGTRICPHCRRHTDEKLCPTDGYKTVRSDLFAEAEGAEALVGTVFDERYRLEAVLGAGGMGAVYRATQLAVNRPVAVKIMRRELAHALDQVARFQQEARTVAALQHPNIVSLIDFGHTDEGQLYLVMELLSGDALGQLLEREGRLEPERVVELGIQLCEALAEAHHAGVVHRDLKPANVFVAKTGRGAEVLKVLDFGIARATGELAPAETLTSTGVSIGSPAYMSPEQAQGEVATPASDLYALGILLYELLTGKLPYEAHTPAGFMMAHVSQRPLPARAAGQVLAGPLVELIYDLLAKTPAERPASAEIVLERLRGCQDAPVAAVAETMPRVTRSPPPAAPPIASSPPDAAFETGGSPERAGGGRLWIVGGAAGIAAVALVIALASGGAEPQSAPHGGVRLDAPADVSRVEPPPEPPEPVTPAEDLVIEAPVSRAMLRLTIDSRPRAAVEVDGEARGLTPVDVEWERGDSPWVRVSKAGYRAARFQLTTVDAGGTKVVRLERLPVPKPAEALEP